MTADQMKFINDIVTEYNEDKKEMRSGGFIVSFADNTLYDSNKSFIKINLEKEFVMSIRVNGDHYTQSKYPFEITTASFEHVVHFDSIYTRENIVEAVKLLSGGISEYQEERLNKWVENIRVANAAPMEDRPYYKTDPIIPSKYTPPRARPDLEKGDTVYDQGGFNSL